MSNIESGFCPVGEYTAFEETRCQNEEFQVDELYMMMFALQSRQKGQQAAKKPGRITDIERQDHGLYVVKMSILNADLTPDCDTRASFWDGYWQRKDSPEVTVGGHPIKTAYLKTYGGRLDDELHTLIQEHLSAPPTQEEILEPIFA